MLVELQGSAPRFKVIDVPSLQNLITLEFAGFVGEGALQVACVFLELFGEILAIIKMGNSGLDGAISPDTAKNPTPYSLAGREKRYKLL